MTDRSETTKTPPMAIDFGGSNGAAAATPDLVRQRAHRVRRAGRTAPGGPGRWPGLRAGRVAGRHHRLRSGRPDRGHLRGAGRPLAGRHRRLGRRAAS